MTHGSDFCAGRLRSLGMAAARSKAECESSASFEYAVDESRLAGCERAIEIGSMQIKTFSETDETIPRLVILSFFFLLSQNTKLYRISREPTVTSTLCISHI